MKKLLVILLLLFPVTSVYGVSLKELFDGGKELFEKGTNKGKRTLDDVWNYDLEKLFETNQDRQKRMEQLRTKMIMRPCTKSPFGSGPVYYQGRYDGVCEEWWFEYERLKEVDEYKKQQQIEKKQREEPMSTSEKQIYWMMGILISIPCLIFLYSFLNIIGVIRLIKEFFKFILKLIKYLFPKVTKFFEQRFFPRLRKILKKLYD